MSQDDADRVDPTDDTEPSHPADEQVDALSALSNEHRLAILLALGDRETATRTNDAALSFSELYGAVDVDSSSQFSYHLSQLVGRFVTEADDGYHLTYAGDEIVRAVRSGRYESAPAFDSVDLPGACLACEATELQASLDGERFVVRCRACDRAMLSDSFPRSQALDRTPEAVAESFGYRIWSAYLLVRGGVCPECYGRTARRVDAHDDADSHTFAAVCRTCDFTVHLPLEVPALFHPAAVAALWRHGVSLLDCPLWELFELFVSDAWTTEVASRSPLAARFRLSLDGDALELAMDEDFAVTTVEERVDGPDGPAVRSKIFE
ncbi:MAG: ArsR/SmtB family transcription factor [Halosimplex sp.]